MPLVHFGVAQGVQGDGRVAGAARPAPAVPVFRIAGLSIFGMSMASVMAPQWIARGYFLRNAAMALFACAMSVAGNYVFIPRYGMMACAWMMVGSYSIHLIGNVVFLVWIERRARLQRFLPGALTVSASDG